MSNRDNPKAYYDELLAEEKLLTFPSFSNEDALRLGKTIIEMAKEHPQPLGLEIMLNGLMVFRYYPTGITRDHQMWLQRKRNAVELRDTSSLRLTVFFEMNGATLTDWKLNPDDYCLDGGGYPIRVAGGSVIGSVCASGYAGIDDHRIVVRAIRRMLGLEE